MTKVAVAMSGGVDSSVAAALCIEKYSPKNVFGVTAKLFCYAENNLNEKSCCSVEAINDAKKVCMKLGIPHYVLSEESEFEKTVIWDFISEYKKGHTPIPCILCNSKIKFGTMFSGVQKLGAEKIVTGHYARIKEDNGKFFLLKGKDKLKDQSYFLYSLTQNQLTSIEFPIGAMTKKEVREKAKALGLSVAEKKESQGICFVGEERVTDWLAGKIKNKPGNIVDTAGNVLGRHEGIIYYTIGQRKRILGGFPEPMYVVGIDVEKNQVIIGTEKELYRKTLTFITPHWINEIKFPLKCTAKIRYNMDEMPCTVNKNTVSFKKPQRAVTPGQSIVFYSNEIVLGGGIISE